MMLVKYSGSHVYGDTLDTLILASAKIHTVESIR